MNYEQALAHHNMPRPHFQKIAGETRQQEHERFNAEIAALQPYFKRSGLQDRLTFQYHEKRFYTSIWHMHHNPKTLDKLALIQSNIDAIEQELEALK